MKKIAIIIVVLCSYLAYGDYVRDIDYFAVPDTISEDRTAVENILEGLLEVVNARQGGELTIKDNYEDNRKDFGYISGSIGEGIVGSVAILIDLADYYSATNPDDPITEEGFNNRVTVWIDASASLSIGLLPFSFGSFWIPFDDEEPDPKRTINLEGPAATAPFFQINTWEMNESGEVIWDLIDCDLIFELSASIMTMGGNLLRFEVDATTFNEVFSIEADLNGDNSIDNSEMILFMNSLIEIITDLDIWKLLPDLTQLQVYQFTSTDDYIYDDYDGLLNHCWGGMDLENDGYPDNIYNVMPDFLGVPIVGQPLLTSFSNNGLYETDYYVKVEYDEPNWWIGPYGEYYSTLFENTRYFDDVEQSNWSTNPEIETLFAVAATNNAAEFCDAEFQLWHNRPWYEQDILYDAVNIRLYKISDNGYEPMIIIDGYGEDLVRYTNEMLNITWDDSDPDDNANICLALDPDLNESPWAGNANHTFIAVGLNEDDDGSQGNFNWTVQGIAAGTYSLWAMIYDGNSTEEFSKCDNTITISDDINVNLSANPLSGYAPLEVEFENNSTGYITEYHWDFGDGYTSNSGGFFVNHVFESPGNYSVNLTVSNSNFFSSDEISINVLEDSQNPSVDITNPANNSVQSDNFVLQFTASDNGSGLEDGEVMIDDIQYYYYQNLDATNQITINSLQMPSGQHTIEVIAHDHSGNTGNDYVNVTFDNGMGSFAHDYAITSISIDPPNPNENDVVTVTGSLMNMGLEEEDSGVVCKFYVDNNFQTQTQNIPSLSPGESCDVSFNWNAQTGTHSLKIQAYLNNDENSVNDFYSHSIYTGAVGLLLVNGSFSPELNLYLLADSGDNFELILQNAGSQAINCDVSKGGNSQSWINLTDGNCVSVQGYSSVNYEFEVEVPSSTGVGNYYANIDFNYNSNNVFVNLIFNVIENDEGSYANSICNSNVEINGESDGVITNFWLGDYPNFWLDNDDSTDDWPTSLDIDPIYFSEDEYKRLNYVEWATGSIREVWETGNSSIYFECNSETLAHFDQDSFGDHNFDATQYITPGNNVFECYLTNYTYHAADALWNVAGSIGRYDLQLAAWGDELNIPSDIYTNFEDHWDRGRLYFNVENVYVSGEVHLYNNSILIDSENISGTGTDYFTIQEDELEQNNYFVIKGDAEDDTHVILNDIYIDVQYFTGDPLLCCNKTVDSNQPNVNSNVTVNINLQNIGANYVDSFNYDDTNNLPAGISFISGDVSFNDGYDIDPGEEYNCSYVITSNTVGPISLSPTVVNYEDEADDEYTSTSNTVSLTCYGGVAEVTGFISNSVFEYGETVFVNAEVTGSILNNSICDALVTCNISNNGNNMNDNQGNVNRERNEYIMGYNSQSGYYELQINDLSPGSYVVDINAQREYYDQGELVDPFYFTVEQDAYPELNNIEVISIEHVSAEISADLATMGEETNVYVRYGLTPEMNIESESISFMVDQRITFIVEELSPFSTYYYQIIADNGLICSTPISSFYTNNDPIIDFPGNITMLEDSEYSITLQDYLEDIDSDILVVEPQSNQFIGITVHGNGDTLLTFIPVNNWFGSQTIVLEIFDNTDLDPLLTELVVNVENVNDPPIIDLPNCISFNNEDVIGIDFSDIIYDFDDDELALSVNGNNYVQVNIDGLYVTFNVDDSWSGEEDLIFYVDDQVNRLVASDLVHIIVFDEYNQNEDLIADFYSSSSSVLVNTQINFYDDSFTANSIVNWEWDFNNDGQIDSYLQNPNWIYEELGTYTVKLTIVDNYGNIAIELKTDYIEIVDELDYDAPVNLSTQCMGEGDVLLDWDDPSQANEQWYAHDNGVNSSQVGLSVGGDFAVASKWDCFQLAIGGATPYLSKIRFFPASDSADYVLKVWQGNNAENEIFSLPIDPVIGEWNEVELDDPIQIGNWGGDHVWVGYEIINQLAFAQPAGCDSGPAVQGWGDMIYYETWGWQSISSYFGDEFDLNWNIEFCVNWDVWWPCSTSSWYSTNKTNDSECQIYVQNEFNSNTFSIKTSKTDTPIINMGMQRALTGYNVFLNDELFDYVTETEYLFEDIIYGLEYEAGVSAVYDEGESEIVTTEFICEPNLDPGFIVINPTIILGDEVCFEDTSYSDNEIVNWRWDFDGDGQIDIEGDPNPCWAYTESGTFLFNITLIIVDLYGYTGEITIPVEIRVDPGIIYPPDNLSLECLGMGDVLFSWSPSLLPNQSDYIIYDDGEPENACAWYDENNERAVWFSSESQNCQVNGGRVHIWNGTWPAGDILTPFTAAIWVYDQETGLPGEILSSVEIEPEHYNWIDFEFPEPVEIDGTEFFLGVIQGGNYPDCSPVAVDETIPVAGRSYEHFLTGGDSWQISEYQDLMIRANVVESGVPARISSISKSVKPLINIDVSDYNNASISCYENNLKIFNQDLTQMGFQNLSTKENPINESVNRDLINYQVYLDGEFQSTTTDTSFIFHNIIYGLEHEAGVNAVYDEGESEIVTTEFICEPNLDPGFIVINPTIILGDEVCFEDTSYSDNEIVNWRWDFDGDGQIDIEDDPNPCWPFTESGTYLVTLIIIDIYGYSGEITLPKDIIVEPSNPPTNLFVECLPDSEALFSWSDLTTPDYGWFHYDNGINLGGIGLQEGGSFYVATRWLADDLTAYDGETISRIRFYIRYNDAQFTLKIWNGEYAENEILSQLVVPESYSWNEIELDNPITIDASSELWVGYRISNQLPDHYSAGCDAGPAVTGYSDLISVDGESWQILSGDAADHNWNIQFYVDGITRPVSLSKSKIQKTSQEFPLSRQNISYTENAFSIQSENTESNRELNGYNVYLDGDFLANITDNQYLLTDIIPGQTYNAGVSAVYDNGTSVISWIDFICGYLIIADFYADNTTIIPGEQVCFTDDSQSNYPIISWRWDFDGDGQTDIEDDPNPCWVYTQAGIYTVTLEIEDSQGNTDQVTYEDYITVLPVQPDWNVNSSDFEYNGSIVSIIYLNDVLVENINGILGCFVGDECRGVASLENNSVLDYTSTIGYVFFTPMVYSNQTSGETLNFKYWDPESGEIFPVWESFEFVADMSIGSFADPYEFHANPYIWIDKDLSSNWNWFSLNVSLDDFSINNVLASIGDSGFMIKNKDYFAQYYDDTYGWLGSLAQFDLTSMYMIKMLEPDTLEICGMPVNVNELEYEIDPGWNWISYSPQASEEINYALSGLGDNVSYIKNKDSFAEYMSSLSTWLGSLDTLLPLDGYKLDADNACSFIYPEPEVLSLGQNIYSDIDNRKCVNSQYRDFDSGNYEFNGSLVISTEDEIDNEAKIYAYCNNEVRGIASVLDYSELIGAKFFALMVYSNQIYEADFQLYFQESDKAELIPLDHYFDFNSDMIIGSFDDPYLINLSQTANDELPAEIPDYTQLRSIYPNPFNPQTNISFDLADDSQVKLEVYNMKGQRIATLVDETRSAGSYNVIWSPDDVASGVYLIRLTTGNLITNKKAILLK